MRVCFHCKNDARRGKLRRHQLHLGSNFSPQNGPQNLPQNWGLENALAVQAVETGHRVEAEGHQSAGCEQAGAAAAEAAVDAEIEFQARARQRERGLLGQAAQARCRLRSAVGLQRAGGGTCVAELPGWQCH